eukprot:4395185-Pyramimonas_sp.AAC.2
MWTLLLPANPSSLSARLHSRFRCAYTRSGHHSQKGREYTHSGHHSHKGRENVPIAGTHPALLCPILLVSGVARILVLTYIHRSRYPSPCGIRCRRSVGGSAPRAFECVRPFKCVRAFECVRAFADVHAAPVCHNTCLARHRETGDTKRKLDAG